MKVLILNCGSSSIKFQLMRTSSRDVLASGLAERIGEPVSKFSCTFAGQEKRKRQLLIENHERGIEIILSELMDEQHGIIASPDEIDAVGHRLVHAGENYNCAVVIDDTVLDVMRQCTSFAPLHNPANIQGVEAAQKYLPGVPQCGLFDTAFHQTMPPRAYLYALPKEYYTEHHLRRYGFHGPSHQYVSQQAAEYLGRDIKDLKIVTCHLGNGASITAIKDGISIDTSMGFTPLEGLMMGTRCGDLDPAIPFHLMKSFDMTPDQVYDVLNKKSGMLGLSHLSNDMRVIEEEILEHKNEAAILAHDVYAYRIKKYIGAYAAAMNGLDVLVFTGGVGEKMPILRELVCSDMEFFGVKLDKARNDRFDDGILDLHADDSRVKVLKIPTNEELMIALETERMLKQS